MPSEDTETQAAISSSKYEGDRISNKSVAIVAERKLSPTGPPSPQPSVNANIVQEKLEEPLKDDNLYTSFDYQYDDQGSQSMDLESDVQDSLGTDFGSNPDEFLRGPMTKDADTSNPVATQDRQNPEDLGSLSDSEPSPLRSLSDPLREELEGLAFGLLNLEKDIKDIKRFEATMARDQNLAWKRMDRIEKLLESRVQ